MVKKKIAYLQFPGSNTENETKNIIICNVIINKDGCTAKVVQK